MTDKEMSSEIKWHRLDDMDNTTYPKKIGDLYLIRIYNRDDGHHYGIARLISAEDYKKAHPNTSVSSKIKYVFINDLNGSAFSKKSDGSNYIDGWNDLLFASTSHSTSRSQSPGNSKVWLDLRNKKS